MGGVCGCGCVGVWVWVCGCVGVGVLVSILILAVCWLNEQLGPVSETGHCRLSIVDPPGTEVGSVRRILSPILEDGQLLSPGVEDRHTEGSLPHLMASYCSEVLYNIFCQRMFDWEQVSWFS